MGFTNYLTSYKLHLLKHVKGVFTFSDTSALNEAEIKSHVSRLANESAVPIPNETYEWLASFFKYVEDKDRMYVYDNVTGLWSYEKGDTKLRNLLTDYFTVLSQIALENKDQIIYRYANHFFG